MRHIMNNTEFSDWYDNINFFPRKWKLIFFILEKQILKEFTRQKFRISKWKSGVNFVLAGLSKKVSQDISSPEFLTPSFKSGLLTKKS